MDTNSQRRPVVKNPDIQDLIFDFTVVLLEKFYRLDRIHEALRVPEHLAVARYPPSRRARYKFRMCLLLWLNRNPREKYKIRTVEQLASVIPTDTRADGQKWLPDQVRLLEVIKRKQKEAVDLEKIISDLKYVVIPAHENYERMFTITCHANWFNPTSHVVMGEVTFTRTKDGEGPIREIQKTAIEKIEVTPNSLVLGIFAASWSLVGIFFSYWAAGHPPKSDKFPFVGHEAEVKWLDFTIIPAFAFVLYNILEFYPV